MNVWIVVDDRDDFLEQLSVVDACLERANDDRSSVGRVERPGQRPIGVAFLAVVLRVRLPVQEARVV